LLNLSSQPSSIARNSKNSATHEIQIAQSTFLSTQIKKRTSVGGIDVDEDFVKELLIKHLRQGDANDRPTLADAFDIY
jgi:hypothetical protein